MENTIQRTTEVLSGQKEIWLAGGCFWGTEEYLSNINGVMVTDVGYANGHTESPTYESVCSQTTGFAETVRVCYDPAHVTLRHIIDMYFQSINPTSVNRQGGDIGDQYRTGIYYTDPNDLTTITESLEQLAKKLGKPVAIECKPLENYYLAEEYHQKYLRKNPQGYCHIPRAMFDYAKNAREYHKLDEKQLKEMLSPLQYEVTQHSATEPPFKNEYHDHFEKGIYVDITTGQPLFLSTDKFGSGCGWPAFSKPIHHKDIVDIVDTTHGMLRTEVRSRNSDSHLGHVFEDGPTEHGGLRYCINSAALRFVPADKMADEGYGHLLSLMD